MDGWTDRKKEERRERKEERKVKKEFRDKLFILQFRHQMSIIGEAEPKRREARGGRLSVEIT
jgi:hypothetical protein